MIELEISTDSSRLDIDWIYGFLSTSYWADGRPKSTVERSLENSLCFGAYMGNRQVSFGRIITDYAVFGFLADIFVAKEHRGKGVGRKLVETMINYPDIKDLKLMFLGTRDAHGLYEKFGFIRVPGSDKMMSLFANEGD
jgi:GNAT superfamily N-acetyltransferase